MNIIKRLLKRFKKAGFYEKCPCGGEMQQIYKYLNSLGHKILVDACKKCGYTRER